MGNGYRASGKKSSNNRPRTAKDTGKSTCSACHNYALLYGAPSIYAGICTACVDKKRAG